MFKEFLAKNGLTLDRLNVLIELAEKGSLIKVAGGPGYETRAAQLSQQLGELETFFQTKLKRRDGKRLVLTGKGLELERIAREALTRLNEFAADCRDQPHVLRIGSGSSNLQWLLLPHAGELQRKLPGVQLILQNSRTIPLVQDLRELRVDLAIVRKNAATRLKRKRLLRLTYSVFVPREMISRGTTTEANELLRTLPIAIVGGGGEFHRTLIEAFRKASIKPNLALQCDSFTDVHRALMTGGYAAILPSSAQSDIDARAFAQLPLPFLKGQERVLCLAWNPRMAAMKPPLEKAVNILSERLASE